MTEKNAQYFANIAIIIGVPIAVVSLMASGYGLYLNRDAINANREAIVAQTAYQMQLDGRSQMEKLFENPEIFSVMLERVPYEEIDDSLLVKAGPLVLSFFQYYSGVHFQQKVGNFPRDLWPSFSEEFCNFVQVPLVRGMWEKDFAEAKFNDEFKESVNACLG
jgi:hypothetical protein